MEQKNGVVDAPSSLNGHRTTTTWWTKTREFEDKRPRTTISTASLLIDLLPSSVSVRHVVFSICHTRQTRVFGIIVNSLIYYLYLVSRKFYESVRRAIL